MSSTDNINRMMLSTETLSSILRKIEQQPITTHTNISIQIYPISVKRKGVLYELTEVKQDILSIRYITKDEYPTLWLTSDGKAITTKNNWYGELFDVSYIPIQPINHSSMCIMTDRKTDGILVILFADRVNNLTNIHYVENKSKTHTILNVEGYIECLPVLDAIKKVHWELNETSEEKIKVHIAEYYTITGREKDRILVKTLINAVKLDIPKLKGELEAVLSSMGVQKKRYTAGMCFIGITKKEDTVNNNMTIYDKIEDLKKQHRTLKKALYLYLRSLPTSEYIERDIIPLVI
jgi:hypothetical protein